MSTVEDFFAPEAVSRDEALWADEWDPSAVFILALDVLGHGWSPVLLHGVQKDGKGCTCTKGTACPSPGKHPVKTGWASAPPMTRDDAAAIEDWRDDHNIGVRTGRDSGLWVLDIDDQEAGERLCEHVMGPGASWPKTFTVRTGGGGLHLYFLLPDGFEIGTSNAALGRAGFPKIDVRGNGGQVVAAWSVTQKGTYEVLTDLPLAETPPRLLDLLRPKPSGATSAATKPATEAEPVTARHDHIATFRVKRELAKLAEMAERGWDGPPWNVTATSVAWNLARLELADWCSYASATADFLHACPTDAGFQGATLERMISSALAKAEPAELGELPPSVDDLLGTAPPLGEDVAPVAGQGEDAAPPTLRITTMAAAALWLRDNLGRGRLAGAMVRDGEVVFCPRLGEDGYVAPANEADHDGPAQVRTLTPVQLAASIFYTHDCRGLDRQGEDYPAPFPEAGARLALEGSAYMPHLRRLRGVVHAPTLREDGSLLSEPGHDSASGLLYLPHPGLVVPPVPDRPNSDEVAAARDLILRMIAGFDFVSESDRANYVGLLLTPSLRALAGPPYKLGAIGAPQPGSGKSLLAAPLRIIHGGVFRGEMPADEAELGKALLSILDCTTGPVVQFDNVSGLLRSSQLAALLTSRVFGGRILGATAEVLRANDRLWVITGNNLAIGGDLPRRTLRVTLDPRVPDPHLRTGSPLRTSKAGPPRVAAN
ncbi:MAG: bifunctional DNA primase/polymerase [Mycobacteriales bacterium]